MENVAVLGQAAAADRGFRPRWGGPGIAVKIVAPLFLAELNAAKPQSRVAVDKDIPDLFFDGTRPAEGAAAAPRASGSARFRAPVPRPPACSGRAARARCSCPGSSCAGSSGPALTPPP